MYLEKIKTVYNLDQRVYKLFFLGSYVHFLSPFVQVRAFFIDEQTWAGHGGNVPLCASNASRWWQCTFIDDHSPVVDYSMHCDLKATSLFSNPLVCYSCKRRKGGQLSLPAEPAVSSAFNGPWGIAR